LITATLRISVSNEKKAEIIRLLRSLVEPTGVKTGCVNCRLYKDVTEQNNILWTEEWDSQEALESHLRSRQYLKILAALDMANVKPEIHFNTVGETKGMQLIEEARGIGARG